MHISEVFEGGPDESRSPLENEVYKLLDKLKIPFRRVDNDSVSTMEECKEIEEVLGVEIRKSIFLCNQKKTTFYLLVMPSGKPFDTGAFTKAAGCPRVSFASAEHMEKRLGVSPGAVTVMSLINDKDDYVQLFIDKEVADAEFFGCNPGANTSHLKLKTSALLKTLLPKMGHNPAIIEL